MLLSSWFCMNYCFSQCCLTYMGCRDNRLDVGYNYNDGKLVVYPSTQGIRLEVITQTVSWSHLEQLIFLIYLPVRGLERLIGMHLFISLISQHPTGCPCRFLTPTDIARLPSKEQGVGVGVSVLIQSSDNRVLLTRRAKHMRTFPSVWVPPGKLV